MKVFQNKLMFSSCRKIFEQLNVLLLLSLLLIFFVSLLWVACCCCCCIFVFVMPCGLAPTVVSNWDAIALLLVFGFWAPRCCRSVLCCCCCGLCSCNMKFTSPTLISLKKMTMMDTFFFLVRFYSFSFLMLVNKFYRYYRPYETKIQ